MVRRSPSPDCPPFGRAVWVRHPHAVGAGVWVRGSNTVPLACMPCGGVWCQALSLPWPPVLWGRQPGFRDPCVPGAVGVGVGAQHRPHGARSCRPALRAVRVAEGRPWGGCRSPLWGASGVRRPLSPGCPPSGRAVGVRYPRAVDAGVRAWGPCTGPVARVPCGGLRATGMAGGVWVQAPPLPCCPPPGCRGLLAACRGCACGCVRCVWCLGGACRGAGCCPSPVPLVPPSLVLCCGVALPVCLPCPLPRARPLLVCWLPLLSFVAASFFTLSSGLRWLALLLGMLVFPASALMCVSVLLLACFLGPGSRALFFLTFSVL